MPHATAPAERAPTVHPCCGTSFNAAASRRSRSPESLSSAESEPSSSALPGSVRGGRGGGGGSAQASAEVDGLVQNARARDSGAVRTEREMLRRAHERGIARRGRAGMAGRVTENSATLV
eukprot:scaffold1453_cov112-Isochrysis_galbana.AAC.8